MDVCLRHSRRVINQRSKMGRTGLRLNSSQGPKYVRVDPNARTNVGRKDKNKWSFLIKILPPIL